MALNQLTLEEQSMASAIWSELMAAPNAEGLEAARQKLMLSPSNVKKAINMEIFRLWQHGRHGVNEENPFK